ncbi:hypothetical protein [Georgenia faecalis]|uniref:Uncharacterized protein n=1 Tax=Georgenia faecalis TaxID=2483799 RepID=A0ABV9D6Y8_9MICO|nr:hypothetical protein [Georgenia faecalis]
MTAASALLASASVWWGTAAAQLGAEETPTPAPERRMTIDTVTPGIGGFLAFFALALAAWLLFRSMTKHVRRVDHNARMQDAAAQDAAGAGAGAAEPDATPDDLGAGDRGRGRHGPAGGSGPAAP